MIEEIQLANAGAYDQNGTRLHSLKKINFIFGSNGSGKTTISRVIEDATNYPNCHIVWEQGKALETRVYNRDFVERHFDAESSIKGIYTFGTNVEVAEKIKTLKGEEAIIDGKLSNLNVMLHGADGNAGKKKERADIESQITDDIWIAKKKLDAVDQAFSGVNNNKRNFFARYLVEAKSNQANLRDLNDLLIDASTVFSGQINEAQPLSPPDYSIITTLEGTKVLSKIVIGKDDVDIAALIKTLGNSDWVQQGRQFFDKLDNQCPFCQQKTDAAFRASLEEYFDASYLQDLSEIDSLLQRYESQTHSILTDYNDPKITESDFLDQDEFRKSVAALQIALSANIELIHSKKKEPSTSVTLHETEQLFVEVENIINIANTKIAANNDTLHNLAKRKRELSAEIWRRLLEDTKNLYDKYETDSAGLDKAISNLTSQIETRVDELKVKRDKIEENERKITSVKPTIDAINKLLKSFGFTNFYLKESAQTGFYEVKRPGGADAKATLSEGEKSFITFLYFYHLTQGSFSATGGTSNRIIVFDDPVSSLDSDILFIVCNLIKGIAAETREGKGAVKQIFVLTHNVYFHKEVTFHKKRSGSVAMNDETFWIVRKYTDRSEVVSSAENPIKSSYELLWTEVRHETPSDTAVQNVMRRILEHYFKFFGGVAPEDVIGRFSGQDKIVCATLMSWVNDGSHFANDDLYMSCEPGQISRYLRVFQQIFELSEHGGHYKMMMGDKYTPLAAVAEAIDEPPVPANDVQATAEHPAAGSAE